MRTIVDYVYILRCLCVSLPCKLSPQFTRVLTIGHLVCCLTLHYSGSDIPYRRNRWKLDLKESGVSHEKKLR